MCRRAKWILFPVESRSAYTTHLPDPHWRKINLDLFPSSHPAALGRVTDTAADNESRATCFGIPASSSSKSVSTSFIKWKIIPANFARPHKWCGLNSNKLCFAFSRLPLSVFFDPDVCSRLATALLTSSLSVGWVGGSARNLVCMFSQNLSTRLSGCSHTCC